MKYIYLISIYCLSIYNIYAMELFLNKVFPSFQKQQEEKPSTKKELPSEIQSIIIKKLHFLLWYDKIVELAKYPPISIGNKKIDAIDLWKIYITNKNKIFEMDKKPFYTREEYNELSCLLSPDQKKDLVINRLPINDEVYSDCCGIPGGKVVAQFSIVPVSCLPFNAVLGVFLYCFGAPFPLVCGISGGLSCATTTAGLGIAYYWHRVRLENNRVLMTFEDV